MSGKRVDRAQICYFRKVVRRYAVVVREDDYCTQVYSESTEMLYEPC